MMFLALMAAMGWRAEAQTVWYVDDGACPFAGDGSQSQPFCSIQVGIDAATDGDTILVAPGTYFEAIDLDGKAIVLRGSGGAEVTTIDATDLDTSAVTCANGETLDTVIEGFTLRGGTGQFRPGGTISAGGGMYIELGSPTVARLVIFDNTADIGGGLYAADSVSRITDCTFIHNRASETGGAMWAQRSNLLVRGCAFVENRSQYNGGAIYLSGGSSELRESVFLSNESTLGGAIFGITVVDSQGIAHPSRPSIVACLFVGNWSRSRGGALFSSGAGSRPVVQSSTFVGNGSGGTGNVIYVQVSEIVLRDSILWGNGPLGGDSIHLWFPPCTIDVDYSLIEGGMSALVHHESCTIQWGAGNTDTVPLFRGLSDDGGDGWGDDPDTPDIDESANDDYGDLRLQADSPAIDAGDPDHAFAPGDADLDGHTRVLCDRVDMGAYEFGIGDYDCDRIVSLNDFAGWGFCTTGPDAEFVEPACAAYDFNVDGHIDLLDYDGWTAVYSNTP